MSRDTMRALLSVTGALAFDASVPDGTIFLVYVNGLPAATIKFSLGVAEVELNPGKPIFDDGRRCSVSSIEVRDTNGMSWTLGSEASRFPAGRGVTQRPG